MLRNVIFDLDGTLVDSLPGIRYSVDAALAAAGMPPLCLDLKPFIGPPIRDILAMVSSASDPALLDLMESAFRASYDSIGWRKTTCQPGARDAIQLLRGAGCMLWVVTNKPEYAARAILDELALADFFQETVSRGSRTPSFATKAEMLANLLERCGLPHADCIMVGDTLEDCQAAAQAGIPCALVPHGYGGGLDGPATAGCRVVAGWGELLAWCGVPCPKPAVPPDPNDKPSVGAADD